MNKRVLIKKLVEKNNIKKALQEMEFLVKEESNQENLTLLKSRFSKLQNDLIKGIHNQEFINRETQAINYAILQFLASLDQPEHSLNTNNYTNANSSNNYIWFLIGLGIFLAILKNIFF